MATSRIAGLNLRRLAGFQSIHTEMLAVMQDITALLVMVQRRPQSAPYLNFESALHFLALGAPRVLVVI